MKTHLLTLTLTFIAGTCIAQPYIPKDFADEPSQTAHAFWQSHGQILDSEGRAVDNLRYYTIGTSPKLFVFDDKVSFVHYYSDPTPDPDTAWRIDLQFVCVPQGIGPGREGTAARSDNPPASETCGTLSAHEADEAYLNYYLPHTGPGLEGVHGYHRLVYEDAWPNIDVHLYSNRIALKVYIVVRPGGNPGDILFRFSGQDQITTPLPNVVKMHLANRSMSLPQAFAWQEAGGTPTALPWLPTWNLTGANDDMVSLTTDTYNTAIPLVIQCGGDLTPQGLETDDPSDNIYWSTFYGDNKEDHGAALDTDTLGRILMGGTTSSAEFPTQNGASHYTAQEADVFLTRFAQAVHSMMWSSFCGGSGEDVAHDLDHNDHGKTYLVGTTSSGTMIPQFFNNLGNYVQASHGGSADGFLLRFGDDGILEWITHFGGSGFDEINGVYADAGHVYVAGETSSAASQTCGVASGNQLSLCDGGGSAYFQSSPGGSPGLSDAFFARFDSAGSLTHSSYLGGNSSDVAHNIGMATDGKLVITGWTGGGNIPSNVTSPCSVPSQGAFPLCDYGNGAYYQDHSPSGFIVRFNEDLETEWGT